MLGDIAVLDSARDGFTTNDETGNKVDDRDAFFGRGRVLWNPSTSSELEFSIFGERARDGGFVLSDLDGLRANPHHIDQDFEGLANRDVLNPSLVWRVLGDQLDFTSVSSWETWDVLETSDFDFSDADSVRRRSEEEQSYFYQELRLGTGGEHRTGEFAWQVGASGFLADAERQAANIFGNDPIPSMMPPPPGSVDLNDGQFDDLGLALFGQLTVPLGAAFELTGGLRYDREEREVDSLHTFDFGTGPSVLGQIDDDETFDEVLPMASASWQVAPDALVYLRAAKGFKAGGFNLAAPAGKESFEAETAWSYELGWRQTFDDERYSLGASAFFIDWEDMQLSLFDAAAGGYVDNAGNSESQGLELEGGAELSDSLDGFATFGLLDTEIKEFTDPFGTDTSGNELPFAPDTTWSVGLSTDGELPSGALWTLTGDYTRIGSFFYDAGNREGDDFGLANLRLGVDSHTYGLAFWVRNLFDEEYEPVAFQPSPDPLAQDVFVGESGAPRVLGFSLSVHL
jgi:iron complex outermembrane receptor protein